MKETIKKLVYTTYSWEHASDLCVSLDVIGYCQSYSPRCMRWSNKAYVCLDCACWNDNGHKAVKYERLEKLLRGQLELRLKRGCVVSPEVIAGLMVPGKVGSGTPIIGTGRGEA